MHKRILLFFAFFCLALFTYRNGLHVPYFNDDYQRVFTSPYEALFTGFVTSNPFDHFYRPLEQMMLAQVQIIWGWDTFPIRLLHLLLHTALAMLVFHALRIWKVNIIPALAGASFVIVSQLSGFVILSNNTLSQLLVTLFSAFALWLLYRYLSSEEKKANRWKYVASGFFYFLALLSKESGVFLILVIPFLIIILRTRSQNPGWLDITRLLIPYAILFVIYWLLRMNANAIPPVFERVNTYVFRFGINIPRNISLFAGQFLLPVSSVTLLKAIYDRNFFTITIILLVTVLFVFFIARAIWKSPYKFLILALSALVLMSWFPTILLMRLTECYVYNALPYLGLIVGMIISYYWETLSSSSILIRSGMAAFFLAILVINMSGANEKANLMTAQGERAEILLPQIISYAKTMPQNVWMYLSSSGNGFTYSRFIMPCFNVCDHADTLMRFYAKRPDVRFYTGDSVSCINATKDHPGITFICDLKTMRVHPIP